MCKSIGVRDDLCASCLDPYWFSLMYCMHVVPTMHPVHSRARDSACAAASFFVRVIASADCIAHVYSD